jgi:hypothetical protein
MPEDRLLELQARPGEMTPPESSLLPAALPAFDRPLDSTTQLGTAPLDDEPTALTARPAAQDELVRPDPLPPTLVPPLEVSAKAERAEALPQSTADAKPAISFEALLGADTPRLELPEATYYPDATRPLLVNDAHFSEPTPPAASANPAPDTGDEEGMDHLFSRLRHRKQERIETGDLQVDRRAMPAPRPALIPTESATSDDEQQQGVSGGEAFDSVTMDEVSLDDWIMSLAPAELDDTEGDDAIVIHGDDWFGELAETSLDDTALEAPLGAADLASDDMADDTVADLRWGLAPAAPASSDIPVATPAPPPAAGPIPWSELAPDEPQPAANQFMREEAPSVEPMLTPAPGMPAPMETRWEPLAAAVTNSTHAYANGYHPSVPLVPAAPAFSPVFDSPPPAVVEQSGMRQDQDEQRAILESLVAADPTNHFARLTLAVAYADGYPEKALTEYRRLIKESEELVPEVIERLKEMIADGGAPTRTHRVLGDAYMKLGQFDLAMAEFQRALSNRPRGAK